MADDEQFSLCWNNFNSNLSAGFHESLCRGDLVDVTLAAEGQFVKAHRLVLSVCSPYFRKMFTQMPAHQHAFVFLKDVSHSALKDLIQFMYCGEVNVKQEALPAFISTAEALQIKGLTDSDPAPPQSPPKSSTPAPQPAPAQQQQQITPPRVRQRTSTSRSYKIETIDDSGDDNKPTQIVIQTTAAPQQTQQTTIVQHQQQQTLHHQPHHQQAATTTAVVTQKRPATQRSISTVHTKRVKSSLDPLESNETAATQQISVQNVVTESKVHTEPEFIDLPIELPTKSEPDYAEDTGEVETAEQETTYVEDDSYGDMRYDENYFTENEEAANTTGGNAGVGATTSKAIVKQQPGSFSDSNYVETADQSANEAQEATSILTKQRQRRGRKGKCLPKPEKMIDKIALCVTKTEGQQVVYASTTKGGMKIIYQGHHFKYSFRTSMYSVFQCCYKENNEQCKVRVVVYNRRIYDLDGEHVHFNQALDKSVTSLVLDSIPDDDDDEKDAQPRTEISSEDGLSEEEIAVDVEEPIKQHDDSVSIFNPDDFREQIKKRLQKALSAKKK